MIEERWSAREYQQADGATGVSVVAYFENTTPVGSMKEVAKEAVTRINRQAAWEAVATALAARRPAQPDSAQIRRLLGTLDTTKDEVARRNTLFWLGLFGKNDPAVQEKLLSLFRTSKDQRVRQAAVEAIGMLGIQEARPDVEAVLKGAKKLGDWDNSDTEQVWYLLRALGRLGEGDLRSRVPTSDVNKRRLLIELAQFQETGEIPAMTEAEKEELAKARKNVRG